MRDKVDTDSFSGHKDFRNSFNYSTNTLRPTTTLPSESLVDRNIRDVVLGYIISNIKFLSN